MFTPIQTTFQRVCLITGTLAVLSTQTQAVAPITPVITSPANGATISQPSLDVQLSLNGILERWTDVKSVKIRSNGNVIGHALPTSLFGEWSFPDTSHLSVMVGATPEEVMVDYSPPYPASMFWFNGSFTTPTTLTDTNQNVTLNFSFNNTGLLNVVITGAPPLGTRNLSGGLSQNEKYHFKWTNPPEGIQSLTAEVAYLEEGTTTLRTITSAAVGVTVKRPKAPEIVVQQPAGSNLTDGTAKRSFGTVKVGKFGTAKIFTIKNIGTASLTGLAITKNGAHATNFIVTSPAKTSLAPGASTTFKVNFKPTAVGTRIAAIHISSNDANENPFDIKVTGLGATP